MRDEFGRMCKSDVGLYNLILLQKYIFFGKWNDFGFFFDVIHKSIILLREWMFIFRHFYNV